MVDLTKTRATSFTRSLIALGLGADRSSAALIAKRWRGSPDIAEYFQKSAVSASTTGNTSQLMLPETREFMNWVTPQTLIGRLSRLKRVPFNRGVAFATGGGVFAWVGEAGSVPVGRLLWERASLVPAKAGGILVFTKELLESTSPAAEANIRDPLAAGLVTFTDTVFTDATLAATPENPASITNAAPSFSATGTDAAAVRADLIALLAAIADAMGTLDGVALLMDDVVAFAIATMLNPAGGPLFPNLGVAGGSIFGVPVLTSSVLGEQIVALHAPSILLADDGEVEVSAAQHATLRMDTAPDTPGDLVSLWQTNSTALKVTRYINWEVARAGAVQVLNSVEYARVGS